MNHKTSCWNCGEGVVGTLLCGSCKSLQPPPSNYFEFFGYSGEILALDQADLEKRFYGLSRQLHPDLYIRRGERERGYSLEATALLNDGYRTLRNPVERAEYVLKNNGFDIGEQRSKNVPAELLEEVFELNMALEEMRHGDAEALPQLKGAQARFTRMIAGLDAELDRDFAAFDAGGGRPVLERIRSILNRRKYIHNLVREVESTLAEV